jgi:hypothetical protein
MADQISSFGSTAKDLSRNLLGIIALFIVLVYSFAVLLTATASLQPDERKPLIYFLVIFPILVLGVFTWLVAFKNVALFSPADFKDEDNWVKMQLSAVATAAVSKNTSATQTELTDIVEAVQVSAFPSMTTFSGWHSSILWVDDRPENNVHDRRAFEAVGLPIQISLIDK